MPPEPRDGLPAPQQVVPEDREMWLGIRRGLKQMVSAIEKRYGFETRERD